MSNFSVSHVVTASKCMIVRITEFDGPTYDVHLLPGSRLVLPRELDCQVEILGVFPYKKDE